MGHLTEETAVKPPYPPALVILALLIATLACSLTREEIEPTAVPTDDLPATIEAGRGATVNNSVPPPTVSVTGINPPSPIELGNTAVISVNVTHESPLSALILEVARTDTLQSGQAPQFEIASRIDLAAETTEADESILWQPFDAGTYQLVVLAASETGVGESIQVPIEIVAPEVVESAVGGAGANDPGPCIISPAEGAVTMRSNPTSNSSRVGSLGEGEQATAQALGRDASWQGWYQITVNGTTGWVKGTLVTNEGGCTPGVHLQLQE